MSKKTKKIPKLCRHKGLQKGYVRQGGSKGKPVYFKGKYTDDGPDKELEANYKHWVSQFKAKRDMPNGCGTIAALIEVYARHLLAKAERKEGSEEDKTKAREEAKSNIRRQMEVFQNQLSEHPASLGVEQFNTIRQYWIDTRDLTTTTLKRYFSDVRGMVLYGVSRGYMPVDCKTAIDSLPNITVDEYPTLKEPTVRDAANLDDVRATLPHLNRMHRIMVCTIMATGMRPGEMCNLRWSEIDRSEDLWKYVPSSHKTKKKGKARILYFRPELQSMLSEWQKSRPLPQNDFLFTARESYIIGRSRQLGKNTTMQTLLEMSTKFPEIGLRTRVLRQAVDRACLKAGIPKWTPYQTRHWYAYHKLSVFAKLFAGGQNADQAMLEGVASLLGHATTRTTRRYTGANNALAAALTVKGDSIVEALTS